MGWDTGLGLREVRSLRQGDAVGHASVTGGWRVRVHYDDMALFEVIDEGMHVVEVDAATLVITALGSCRKSNAYMRGTRDSRIHLVVQKH